MTAFHALIVLGRYCSTKNSHPRVFYDVESLGQVGESTNLTAKVNVGRRGPSTQTRKMATVKAGLEGITYLFSTHSAIAYLKTTLRFYL